MIISAILAQLFREKIGFFVGRAISTILDVMVYEVCAMFRQVGLGQP